MIGTCCSTLAGGKLPVKAIYINTRAWIEVRDMPLKYMAYTEGTQDYQLAEYAEGSFELEDQKVTLSMISAKQKDTGAVPFTVSSKSPKPSR